MRRVAILSTTLVVGALAAGPAAQTAAPRTAKTLDIYVADTEGGKAALFVSPGGQTVLVDAGNPGERDLNRIVAMLTEAGVKQLDYLISTHYHVDHVGGIAELAKRIPIAHFVDHGPNTELKEQVPGFDATYTELWSKAKHTVVKPGDRLPVAGLDWRIVTSAGAVLKTPLPGGGRSNPACAEFQKRPDPANPDDNAASVGSVVTFGQFRLIDLGDLLWNKEGELMCPNNPIGTVDLYMVTHHGLAQSGPAALVHGVRPRVAVMQNGTRKGGAVAAFEIMRKSPGLEDIWQLHWSYAGGIEHNSPGLFIANVDDNQTIANVLTAPPPSGRGAGGASAAPAGAAAAAAPPAGSPSAAQAPPAGAAPGTPAAAPATGGAMPGGRGGGRGAAAAHTPAHYLKISAASDGTFTITNTRNGFSKTYRKRSS